MGPVGGGVPDDFSVRLRATLVAAGVRRVDVQRRAGRPRARVLLDGEVLLDNWNPTERGEAFYGHGQRRARADRRSRRPASRYELVVEAIPAAPALGGLSVGLEPPAADDLIDRAVDGRARAPTRSCASSAPTASGRPRATTASR